MKQIVLLVAMMALPFLASAKSVEVGIDGMVCPFCAQGIEKNFKKIDAVEDVKVDLDKKSVQLKIKDGASFSEHQIREVIKGAGYQTRSIEGF